MFPNHSPWPGTLQDGGDWQDADERRVQIALDEGRLRSPALVREKGVPLEHMDPEEIVSCLECGVMVDAAARPLESRRMPGKGVQSGENVAGVFCPGCDHRLLSVDSYRERVGQDDTSDDGEAESPAGAENGSPAERSEQGDQVSESEEQPA